jgi:hypothetical protein
MMRRRVGNRGGGVSLLGRVFLVLLAFGVIAAIVLVATPQGRTAVTAALLVTQVLPIPVKPQELVTGAPTAERVLDRMKTLGA